jgi:hypothetical protein
MTDRHISDDRLIEICVTDPRDRRPQTMTEQTHLIACARCESRRVDIVAILDELDAAATQEAGDAFPHTRLERQHQRILQRVDADGRPGQVVAFPTARPAVTFMTPSRPRMRWAAGMAAAAFIAGVITGQWTHRVATAADVPVALHVVANETDQALLRPVPTTFSEEEFLGQIEVAGSRNGPAALRPLDAMTPRAWEVR